VTQIYQQQCVLSRCLPADAASVHHVVTGTLGACLAAGGGGGGAWSLREAGERRTRGGASQDSHKRHAQATAGRAARRWLQQESTGAPLVGAMILV
jgi:hypothetical protein